MKEQHGDVVGAVAGLVVRLQVLAAVHHAHLVGQALDVDSVVRVCEALAVDVVVVQRGDVLNEVTFNEDLHLLRSELVQLGGQTLVQILYGIVNVVEVQSEISSALHDLDLCLTRQTCKYHLS